MSEANEPKPTAETITVEAIGAVRAAFLEGRCGRRPADDGDLAAWATSEAKVKIGELARSAINVFVKEAQDGVA